MVEILKNFAYHLLQSDFYLQNKFNRMFLSFFASFLTSKRFVLFEVIFLLRLDSLASKSVFVFKCACANLSLKTLAAKVLNLQ